MTTDALRAEIAAWHSLHPNTNVTTWCDAQGRCAASISVAERGGPAATQYAATREAAWRAARTQYELAAERAAMAAAVCRWNRAAQGYTAEWATPDDHNAEQLKYQIVVRRAATYVHVFRLSAVSARETLDMLYTLNIGKARPERGACVPLAATQ